MEPPDTRGLLTTAITGELPDLEEQLLSGVTIVLAAPAADRARDGTELAD